MDLLKERIKSEYKVKEGNVIKVDSFLNHQIDVELLNEMGKEFQRRFKDVEIDKIVTAETSGIAIATIVAQHFRVPMVYARKRESQNLSEDKYSTDVYSYTQNKTYKMMISKEYLKEGERVLIIDDFLANGRAISGLLDLVHEAKATLVGVGVAIEKGFQVGGQALRDEGVKLESLAIIDEIVDGELRFR